MIDGGAVAGEAFEDLFGGLVPHKGFRVLVPGSGPLADVIGQFFGGAVGTALQLLGGQRREPPFDEVHPRSVGGGEVEVEPAVAQQPSLHLRGLVGGQVVQDDVDGQLVGHLAVDLVQEGDEVVLVMAGANIGDDGAPSDIERGEQVDGPVALVVMAGPLRGGGQHGQRGGGAVQRLIWGFASTANTAAASGGFMYRPTRSRIFSTRSGSGDTLKLSCCHGLSPKARQISATVVLEIPCLAARPHVDQWVASGGADSSASTTTASMAASAIVRSAPGRGASPRPSRRSWANRRRHFDTVAGWTRSTRAIASLVNPSAQASTMRARNANAWDDECRRTHRHRVSRSESVSSMTAVGRPRRAIAHLRCWLNIGKRASSGKIPIRKDSATKQPDRTLGWRRRPARRGTPSPPASWPASTVGWWRAWPQQTPQPPPKRPLQ